jgi:hypothetical protein
MIQHDVRSLAREASAAPAATFKRRYRESASMLGLPELIGADFQFAGFGRQMGFPSPRGRSNADVLSQREAIEVVCKLYRP